MQFAVSMLSAQNGVAVPLMCECRFQRLVLKVQARIQVFLAWSKAKTSSLKFSLKTVPTVACSMDAQERPLQSPSDPKFPSCLKRSSNNNSYWY